MYFPRGYQHFRGYLFLSLPPQSQPTPYQRVYFTCLGSNSYKLASQLLTICFLEKRLCWLVFWIRHKLPLDSVVEHKIPPGSGTYLPHLNYIQVLSFHKPQGTLFCNASPWLEVRESIPIHSFRKATKNIQDTNNSFRKLLLLCVGLLSKLNFCDQELDNVLILFHSL